MVRAKRGHYGVPGPGRAAGDARRWTDNHLPPPSIKARRPPGR